VQRGVVSERGAKNTHDASVISQSTTSRIGGEWV
jgi:hypothetical protein